MYNGHVKTVFAVILVYAKVDYCNFSASNMCVVKREKGSYRVCGQRRLRSACAYAHTD